MKMYSSRVDETFSCSYKHKICLHGEGKKRTHLFSIAFHSSNRNGERTTNETNGYYRGEIMNEKKNFVCNDILFFD